MLFADRVSAETMRANQCDCTCRRWLTFSWRSSPLRPERRRTGPGADHDDSPAAAQNRGADPHHGAARVAIHVGSLPLAAGIRPRVGEPALLKLARRF
jgi:hypothetical protein